MSHVFDIPFIDQSTFTTTDKICMMIHDQLIRLEEEFFFFKQDIKHAKQTEKFNEIMRCVRDYVDNSDNSEKYHIYADYNPDNVVCVFDGNGTQLPMSICTKHLSHKRVQQIWRKLFPIAKEKAMMALLDEWNDDGHENNDHVVYCVDHDGPEEMKHWDIMALYTYTDAEVKSVLNEMTMTEIAGIQPDIRYVHRKLLNPTV